MTFFLEILWGLLIEYVICLPGAFVLWIFSKRKTEFTEFLWTHEGRSLLTGLIFWAVVIVLGTVLLK